MSEQGRVQRDRLEGASEPGRPQPRGPTRRAKAALPIATMGEGMLVREVRVAPPDVVFVKGLVEASDGLAAVFAERGGDLTLVAPLDRGPELAEFCADLAADLGACVGPATRFTSAPGAEERS